MAFRVLERDRRWFAALLFKSRQLLLFQRFELSLADDRDVPIDSTFVLRPAGPVNLVVRMRV